MFRTLFALVLALLVAPVSVSVQAQTLPPTARNVYKCEVDGKAMYSDEPCLGATRVDVTPTRGVNKTTGSVRMGADVRKELNSEAMGEALRPLTGQDTDQWKRSARRVRLAPAERVRCGVLDGQLAAAEADEARAGADRLPEIQKKLMALRQTFFDLRC